MQHIDCNLSVIALPAHWETSENVVQFCTYWGELAPGQFYSFLPLEREVSTIEKRLQSNLWDVLKAENAPLRALVNGKLSSVPEDFYDHIIIKYVPDGEFVMAQLMGMFLLFWVGNYGIINTKFPGLPLGDKTKQSVSKGCDIE